MIKFARLEVGMELEAKTSTGDWRPARVAEMCKRISNIDVVWVDIWWPEQTEEQRGGALAVSRVVRCLEELRPIRKGNE